MASICMEGTVPTSVNCKEVAMKVANSFIGVTGCALFLYSLWMVGVCVKDINMNDHHRLLQLPWFVLACLASGFSLCLISCIGHAAADVRRDICLSCYLVFVFVLLMLEAFVAAVYLNPGLKKDFTEDPARNFDYLVDYVNSHLGIFTWVIILTAFAQAVAFLVAVALRTSEINWYSRFKLRNYENLPIVNSLSLLQDSVASEPQFISSSMWAK